MKSVPERILQIALVDPVVNEALYVYQSTDMSLEDFLVFVVDRQHTVTQSYRQRMLNLYVKVCRNCVNFLTQ